MNEKTVIITERDGGYQVQNNGFSDFALIGILECIVFEMKSASREQPSAALKDFQAEQNNINQEQNETNQNQKSEVVKKGTSKEEPDQESPTPDIRMRISNAIKAIRALGGRIEEIDLSTLTEEELKLELEELTGQYKRLKSTKTNK